MPEGDTEVYAVVYEDTNGNEDYDFPSADDGTDGPYTLDGSPVSDAATVTVPGATNRTTDESEVTDPDRVSTEFVLQLVGATPIEAGETLTAVATVGNRGDEQGTQTVRLLVNGTERDSTTLTLEGGEQTQVTLSWQTDRDDAGTYEVVVASENATRETTVQVGPPASDEATTAGETGPGFGVGPALLVLALIGVRRACSHRD